MDRSSQDFKLTRYDERNGVTTLEFRRTLKTNNGQGDQPDVQLIVSLFAFSRILASLSNYHLVALAAECLGKVLECVRQKQLLVSGWSLKYHYSFPLAQSKPETARQENRYRLESLAAWAPRGFSTARKYAALLLWDYLGFESALTVQIDEFKTGSQRPLFTFISVKTLAKKRNTSSVLL